MLMPEGVAVISRADGILPDIQADALFTFSLVGIIRLSKSPVIVSAGSHLRPFFLMPTIDPILDRVEGKQFAFRHNEQVFKNLVVPVFLRVTRTRFHVNHRVMDRESEIVKEYLLPCRGDRLPSPIGVLHVVDIPYHRAARFSNAVELRGDALECSEGESMPGILTSVIIRRTRHGQINAIVGEGFQHGAGIACEDLIEREVYHVALLMVAGDAHRVPLR